MEEDNISVFEIVKKGSKTYNLKYKIIVIGDSSVGKTCICLKQSKNSFVNEYIETKGYDTYISDLKYKDILMKLEMFDASGDEKYISIISNLYKKTSLAMIVYSIDE